MKVIEKSGGLNLSTQDMEGYGAGVWSSGAQLIVKAKKQGDFVELEMPAPDATPRQVVLYLTQAPDFGTLRFTVNGQPSATTFDGYAPKVQLAPAVKLGVFTPKDGRLILRAEVDGANPQSRGAKFFFGLDCAVMEKPDALP